MTDTIDPMVASITAEALTAASHDDLKAIVALALEDEFYLRVVLGCLAGVASTAPLVGRWGHHNNVEKFTPVWCAQMLMASVKHSEQNKTHELVILACERPTAYVIEVLRELMRVIAGINAEEAG